jgi:hypothetical protein
MTEHNYTDEITCPHCGYEHGDSWESSDDGVTECDECGERFFFARDVEVTYSSRPEQKCQYLDDHGMNCAWEPGNDERPNADEPCRECAYEAWSRARTLEWLRKDAL